MLLPLVLLAAFQSDVASSPTKGDAAVPSRNAITISQETGFITQPSRRDLQRVMPSALANRGIEGSVVLRCDVITDGKLAGCIVENETPQGFGFGAAAYKLTPLFQLGPLPGGALPAGGTIRIPIHFGFER